MHMKIKHTKNYYKIYWANYNLEIYLNLTSKHKLLIDNSSISLWIYKKRYIKI